MGTLHHLPLRGNPPVDLMAIDTAAELAGLLRRNQELRRLSIRQLTLAAERLEAALAVADRLGGLLPPGPQKDRYDQNRDRIALLLDLARDKVKQL